MAATLEAGKLEDCQSDSLSAEKPKCVVFPYRNQSEKEKLDERDGVHGSRQETMPPGKSSSIEGDLILTDLMPANSQLAFEVSQMLNRENNRAVRNWKHLAESLGVPGDVCLLFMCDQELSPTEDLFSYLETWKPSMNIGCLKKALRNMGRNDLVNYLEKESIADADKVTDHPEIIDIFKEKLDAQSRTLSWTQLAIKCGIPKKIYLKFGKPKLGSTAQLFLHIRLNDAFNTLTIKKLKEHLEGMNRFDVLRILAQHKISDEELVKDHFLVDTPIMDETSELLDKELRSTNNWRNLAVRLGIANRTYEDFDTSKANNKNLTVLLLNWLEASQPQLKASDFLKHLKKIHRNDVVESLEKAIPAAIKRIQQKQFDAEREDMTNRFTGLMYQGGEVVSDSAFGNHSINTSHSSEQHEVGRNKEQAEDRRDLLVTDIPYHIYSKICALLDAEDPFYRDYRMLAEALGVNHDRIRILRERKSSEPTHSLFVQYKLKVKNFMEILKKIEREDVIGVLENWIDQEQSKTLSTKTKSLVLDEL